MLTDEEIDCLFEGRIAFIPEALAEQLPRYPGYATGRETVVLVWRLIRNMELGRQKHRRHRPVSIHTDCFEDIPSPKTVIKAKEWLQEKGFIDYSDSYLAGHKSKEYRTLIRRATFKYELKHKSTSQIMPRRTDAELACCLTRSKLDRLVADVEGAKATFKALLSEYLETEKADGERNESDLNCLIAPFQQIVWRKGAVKRGRHGNRLFSPLSQLKSTFRQHLYLDGQELAYVDMQACQPTLLSYIADDKKLLRACYEDALYGMIASELNVERDEAKTAYCAYSFGPNRLPDTKNRQAFEVQGLVKREFPKTAEYVWRVKEGNYRKFARGLQKKEADIFIDDCLVRLRLSQVPVLSIHDCLVTTQKHLPYVLTFAKKHIQELGIKAKFKTE